MRVAGEAATIRSASAKTVWLQRRLSNVSPQYSRAIIVSPEKKATTSWPLIRDAMRMEVEKPRIRPDSTSRSMITDSFSPRSTSNRVRQVPSKYSSSSPYISSRSAWVRFVRPTTEPARRRSRRGSEGGGVNVDRALVKLFMQLTSFGPFSQVQCASIKDMSVSSRNRQQRIAGIQPDQEIAEPAQPG